jgi:hypothetical protein
VFVPYRRIYSGFPGSHGLRCRAFNPRCRQEVDTRQILNGIAQGVSSQTRPPWNGGLFNLFFSDNLITGLAMFASKSLVPKQGGLMFFHENFLIEISVVLGLMLLVAALVVVCLRKRGVKQHQRSPVVAVGGVSSRPLRLEITVSLGAKELLRRHLNHPINDEGPEAEFFVLLPGAGGAQIEKFKIRAVRIIKANDPIGVHANPDIREWLSEHGGYERVVFESSGSLGTFTCACAPEYREKLVRGIMLSRRK